jgi:phosphotransferase system enzyme I (PtsI)
MGQRFEGIAVSSGIAIGEAFFPGVDDPEVALYVLPTALLDEEVARFEAAVESARVHLEAIRAGLPEDIPREVNALLEVHLMLLQDQALAGAPVQLIRSTQCNAEWALKQQRDSLVHRFDAMEDPYLRTRADDIDQVTGLVLRLLSQVGPPAGGQEARLDGRVAVAEAVSPADLVLLHHRGVVGLVTERGGPTSHAAILARSLGLPAVVGVQRARERLREGQAVVVDGDSGVVFAGLSRARLAAFEHQRRQARHRQALLLRQKDRPAVSRDGIATELLANIELPGDVAMMRRVGADGVGLYRTEFMFMNRSEPPSEEEQLTLLHELLAAVDGAPVTIRSLDLGGDKLLGSDALDARSVNPALGVRGIRLVHRHLSLLEPQLRAILRASADGPVSLMLPMVSSVQEVDGFLGLIAETKRALRHQGLPFDPALPVGVMVEVPAAALCAPALAQRVDFLSLGTNDLVQYTLAVDRADEQVGHLYDPLHPAVLRLIHRTLRAGARAGKPVTLCGEMAAETRYTRLLLGLGLRRFSMRPGSLLEVKQVIRASEVGPLARLAREVLTANGPERLMAAMAALGGNRGATGAGGRRRRQY